MITITQRAAESNRRRYSDNEGVLLFWDPTWEGMTFLHRPPPLLMFALVLPKAQLWG